MDLTTSDLEKKLQVYRKRIYFLNALSIAAGLATFVGIEERVHEIRAMGQIEEALPFIDHCKIALGSAGISITLNGMAQSFVDKVHLGKMILSLIMPRKEEQYAQQALNPEMAWSLQAQIYYKKRDYERYILCQEKKMVFEATHKIPRPFAEKCVGYLVILPVQLCLYIIKDPMQREISRASLLHLAGLKRASAKRIAKLPECFPERRGSLEILAGVWWRALGEHEQAQKHFLQALHTLLEKEKPETFMQSRKVHEIREIQTNPSAQDVFIFKCSKSYERITREWEIAQLHQQCYQKRHPSSRFVFDGVPCEEPLELLKVGQYYTLVSRRVQRKMLADSALAERDYYPAITHLIELMACSTPFYSEKHKEEKMHDYKEEFERRCVRRFGNHRFVEEYKRELERLQQLRDNVAIPVLAHRDASLYNVLEGGYIIDFEDAGMSDHVHDIATLLADCPQNADSLFRYAWKQWKEQFHHKGEQETHDLFEKIRTQNALCQVSSLLERKKYPKQAQRLVQGINQRLLQVDSDIATSCMEYLSSPLATIG